MSEEQLKTLPERRLVHVDDVVIWMHEMWRDASQMAMMSESIAWRMFSIEFQRRFPSAGR